jgi:hypothetical protein
MKLRWKNLGSALSTARMMSRMGDFIQTSKFFIKQISDLVSGKKKLSEFTK